jgi:hypothetical protein
MDAFVCNLGEEFLHCDTRFSDRFVFSKYFVPLQVTFEDSDVPLLTVVQVDTLLDYSALDPKGFAQVTEKHQEVFEENGIVLPALDRPADDTLDGGYGEMHGPSTSVEEGGLATEHLRTELGEVGSLLRAVRGEELSRAAPVVDLIESKLERLTQQTEALVRKDEATLGEAGASTERSDRSAAVTATEAHMDIDLLANLLKSEIGYLFLDRTRIRPSGFAVGEHVFALSLAPGEEVVLEQRTFSKRQTTLEEQTEREEQFDLELSSTLSTELQEGFEFEKNLSNSSGFTAGGNVGGNIFGIEIGAQLSDSKNVTEASNSSRRRSLKDSFTSSAKTASKYRTLHKVTFKLSTEEGFESTSKRLMRNPNRHTPVQFHYFKILRVLDMFQERQGVRLCWSPCVKDPGFDLTERIRKGKEEILKRVEQVELPPRPTPPAKQDKPAVEKSTGLIPADKWGLFCDMRFDYLIEIQGPADYVWDDNGQAVKDSVSLTTAGVSRGVNAYVVDEPWADGSSVKFKYHIGVDWKSPIGGCGSIYITAKARFVPDPSVADPEYQKAHAAYVTKLGEWHGKVDSILKEARQRAEREAYEWERDVWSTFNPLGELMNRVIKHHFPSAVRDECWEIDLWREVFDWEAASFILYPSWWSDLQMRDYTKQPTDFLNASWAKLYVPVKIGFELMALRWIFGKQIHTKLDAAKEKAFTRVLKDLDDFRKQHFGDASETSLSSDGGCADLSEKYICLGEWNEVIPTDGTHIEVVHSMSTAGDKATLGEVTDADKLRELLIASETQDVELKKKAVTHVTKPVEVAVNIETDGSTTVE